MFALSASSKIQYSAINAALFQSTISNFKSRRIIQYNILLDRSIMKNIVMASNDTGQHTQKLPSQPNITERLLKDLDKQINKLIYHPVIVGIIFGRIPEATLQAFRHTYGSFTVATNMAFGATLSRAHTLAPPDQKMANATIQVLLEDLQGLSQQGSNGNGRDGGQSDSDDAVQPGMKYNKPAVQFTQQVIEIGLSKSPLHVLATTFPFIHVHHAIATQYSALRDTPLPPALMWPPVAHVVAYDNLFNSLYDSNALDTSSHSDDLYNDIARIATQALDLYVSSIDDALDTWRDKGYASGDVVVAPWRGVGAHVGAVLVDFDQTLSCKDTVARVLECNLECKKQASPASSHAALSQAYEQQLDAALTRYASQSMAAKADVENVLAAHKAKLGANGPAYNTDVFRDVMRVRNEFEREAVRVLQGIELLVGGELDALCAKGREEVGWPGGVGFLQACAVDNVHTEIVSLCWSRALVTGFLQQHQSTHQPLHVVPKIGDPWSNHVLTQPTLNNEAGTGGGMVHLTCNEVIVGEGGVTNGQLDRVCDCSDDKVTRLRAVREMLTQRAEPTTPAAPRTKVVYIGDGLGDIEALIDADVGIIFGEAADLKEFCTALGVLTQPLVTLLETSHYAPPPNQSDPTPQTNHKSDARAAPVLYTSTSWHEVHAVLYPTAPPPRVDYSMYVLTDPKLNKQYNRTIEEAVESTVQGGCTILQIREKDTDGGPFLASVQKVMKTVRRRIPVIINDRVDIALALDCDGVHVGQSDLDCVTVRALIGPHKILGISVRTVQEAILAEQQGADYLGAGAVYPTTVKPDAVYISMDELKRICDAVTIPVVSIGGIYAHNAAPTIHAGCAGVAVVAAVYDRHDSRQGTEALKKVVMEALEESKGGGGV